MRRAAYLAGRGLLLAIFIALIVSNLMLRRQLDAANAAVRGGRPAVLPLQAGEAVPALWVQAAAEAPRMFTMRGAIAQTLLIVDPRCTHCDAALAELHERPYVGISVVSLRPRSESDHVIKAVPREVPLYFVDRTHVNPLLTRVAHLPAVIRISSQGTLIAQCNSLRICGADDNGCRDCAVQ